MKFVNRGYLLVKPTLSFIEWANGMEDDIVLDSNFIEGNIYLIEEDFMETEPILKANFKAIFKSEFTAISDREEEWPCELTFDNFETYFHVEFGTTVFDTLKSDLKKD